MRFEVDYVQEQGPRDYQEDRLYASENLIAVIDGMGGHRDGTLAAEAALRVLEGASVSSAEDMRELILDCAAAVEVLGLPGEYRPPGAVIALAAIAGDKLIVGHCGDSRVVYNGEQVTRSHAHMTGGIIFALGGGCGVRAPVSTYDVALGDSVVVATDGFDRVYEEKLLFDNDIMDIAKAYGLFDNTTAVLAKVVKDR